MCAQRILAAAKQRRQPAVGESLALQGTHLVRIQLTHGTVAQTVFGRHQVTDLYQEPGIDGCQFMQVGQRQAGTEAVSEIPETLRPRHTKFLAQIPAGIFLGQVEHFVQAIHAGFQSAQRLLQRFLEGTADCHHLAD